MSLRKRFLSFFLSFLIFFTSFSPLVFAKSYEPKYHEGLYYRIIFLKVAIALGLNIEYKKENIEWYEFFPADDYRPEGFRYDFASYKEWEIGYQIEDDKSNYILIDDEFYAYILNYVSNLEKYFDPYGHYDKVLKYSCNKVNGDFVNSVTNTRAVFLPDCYFTGNEQEADKYVDYFIANAEKFTREDIVNENKNNYLSKNESDKKGIFSDFWNWLKGILKDILNAILNIPQILGNIFDFIIQLPDVIGNFIFSISELLDSILESVKSIPKKIFDLFFSAPTKQIDFEPFKFSITKKFPFCIPADLMSAVSMLNVSPSAPVWIVNFKNASFDIDFSGFEDLAQITRWGVTVFYLFILIILTRKVVS